eukprot:scaffold249325_cov30-Tisochrysis_lutea.AAC.5
MSTEGKRVVVEKSTSCAFSSVTVVDGRPSSSTVETSMDWSTRRSLSGRCMVSPLGLPVASAVLHG